MTMAKHMEGGVLGNEPLSGEELERWRAEEQRRQEEEQKAAEDFQARCDQVDASIAKHLTDELEAEEEEAKIGDRQRGDFAMFRTYCDQWGWPALPSVPQAVSAFLISEMNLGDAVRTTRLCNSISAIHHACGFDFDPSRDLYVRAVLRRARTNSNNQPQETNHQA